MQTSRIVLNNGISIPALGYGTYCRPPKDRIKESLPIALCTGYRLVDTAQNYHNEHFIGEILHESEISRENLFITTKIWKPAMQLNLVMESFEESLENLQTDYVDLLLIHRPLSQYNAQTWEVMEDLYREGRAKAIGVSNFIIRHLDQLAETSSTIPAVNQIEFHPFFNRQGLFDYCFEKSITIESYSPIALGKRLDDPRLIKIANDYQKTPAQIMLRWNLQKGCVVIPRSLSQSHILENFNVFDFELSKTYMIEMDSWNENYNVIGPDQDEPDFF